MIANTLDSAIYRSLDSGDTGACYTFDIDKTYLDTQFATLGAVLKLLVELAIDKRPYPGVPLLIRGLQRGTEKTGRDRPVFFLSASPKQMRPVLERRLVLDEIALDGLTLKNWRAVVSQRGARKLRDQVGYKLCALMLARQALPKGAYEILFGDDTESDAFSYDLYAQALRGDCRGGNLYEALRKRDLERDAAKELAALSETLPTAEVRHIFIHALRQRELPKSAIAYQTPIEPAVWLHRDGLIEARVAKTIAEALVRSGAMTATESASILRDL